MLPSHVVPGCHSPPPNPSQTQSSTDQMTFCHGPGLATLGERITRAGMTGPWASQALDRAGHGHELTSRPHSPVGRVPLLPPGTGQDVGAERIHQLPKLTGADGCAPSLPHPIAPPTASGRLSVWILSFPYCAEGKLRPERAGNPCKVTQHGTLDFCPDFL